MQPRIGLEALGRNSRPMEVRIPKLFLSAASRYSGPFYYKKGDEIMDNFTRTIAAAVIVIILVFLFVLGLCNSAPVETILDGHVVTPIVDIDT